MCRIENSGFRLCKNICGFIFVNINHGTYCLLYIERCFLLPTLKTARHFKSRVPTISVFLSVFLFAGGSIVFQIVKNGRMDHVVRVVAWAVNLIWARGLNRCCSYRQRHYPSDTTHHTGMRRLSQVAILKCFYEFWQEILWDDSRLTKCEQFPNVFLLLYTKRKPASLVHRLGCLACFEWSLWKCYITFKTTDTGNLI